MKLVYSTRVIVPYQVPSYCSPAGLRFNDWVLVNFRKRNFDGLGVFVLYSVNAPNFLVLSPLAIISVDWVSFARRCVYLLCDDVTRLGRLLVCL